MPGDSCSSKSIDCAVILTDSKSAAAQPLFPLPPPSKPDGYRGAAISGLPALPAKLQGIDSQMAKLGKWCSCDHQSCQSCG